MHAYFDLITKDIVYINRKFTSFVFPHPSMSLGMHNLRGSEAARQHCEPASQRASEPFVRGTWKHARHPNHDSLPVCHIKLVSVWFTTLNWLLNKKIIIITNNLKLILLGTPTWLLWPLSFESLLGSFLFSLLAAPCKRERKRQKNRGMDMQSVYFLFNCLEQVSSLIIIQSRFSSCYLATSGRKLRAQSRFRR